MLLVATVAVLGFGLPLALAVQSLYRDEALLELSRHAARAVVAVPASFASEKDPPELPDGGPQVSTALYDSRGVKLQGGGPVRADEPVRAALRGSSITQRQDELVVAVPVSEQERVVGAVRVSVPQAAVTGRVRQAWAVMAALAAGVLGAAGVLAARRSRRLAGPLADLRDDAELIGTGVAIPVRDAGGVPEVAAVRTALVEAAGRLDEALEHERALSSDLAHQLRTPLTSLRLRLEGELLRPSGPAGPLEELVRDVLTDVDRLQQTIDDLLTLARETVRTRPAHPLATSVREAGERWAAPAASAERVLVGDVEPHLPWVTPSPAALRQVLDVLLDNALTHGRGAVQLSARRVGDGAVVAVSDAGPGRLDDQTVFVRRSGTAGGSGIGLALARRLAEGEGMRLLLAEPGPGPVFHLVVAAAAPPG